MSCSRCGRRPASPSARWILSGSCSTVDRVYKGEAKAKQSVVTAREGASCGLELTGRGPFLVFATKDPQFDLEGDAGEVYSSLCSGSRALLDAPVPPSFGDRTGGERRELTDRQP